MGTIQRLTNPGYGTAPVSPPVPLRVSAWKLALRDSGQLLEPVVLAQQQVEVEQVVGRKRGAVAILEELGRAPPHLEAHPGRDQEVDDATAGVLGHRALTGGAPEA